MVGGWLAGRQAILTDETFFWDKCSNLPSTRQINLQFACSCQFGIQYLSWLSYKNSDNSLKKKINKAYALSYSLLPLRKVKF